MTRSPEATSVATLLAMLSLRRPEGSKSERQFIAEYIDPLGTAIDSAGNRILRIGTAPILWSAHTDTVHRQGGTQRVRLLDGIASVADWHSNCLGADNASGVWLLREMIQAGVEGLYIFHRGEEVGGTGSMSIAKNTPELLDGIKAAVAFDRRGTKSIITHQWMGRTCSDIFARSLAAGLDLGHEPDDGGTFTDTANYTDLIGECSNVSVGFNHEHRETETQDVRYLLSLREAMLALDLSSLDFAREPGDVDPDAYSRFGDGKSYARRVLDFTRSTYDGTENDPWDFPDTVRGMMREYPDEVTDYLEDLGITPGDLRRAVEDRKLGWQRGR